MDAPRWQLCVRRWWCRMGVAPVLLKERQRRGGLRYTSTARCRDRPCRADGSTCVARRVVTSSTPCRAAGTVMAHGRGSPYRHRVCVVLGRAAHDNPSGAGQGGQNRLVADVASATAQLTSQRVTGRRHPADSARQRRAVGAASASPLGRAPDPGFHFGGASSRLSRMRLYE